MFPFFLECYTCFVNTAVRNSKDLKFSKKNRNQVVCHAISRLNEIKNDPKTPVLESREIVFKKLNELSKNKKDAFAEIKKLSNSEALKYYSSIKDVIKVKNGLEELYNVLKISAAGNVIDFGSGNEGREIQIGEEIKGIGKKKLVMKDKECYGNFKKLLKSAKTVLYLADNAGEIVFDKVLIEYILQHYSGIKKFVVAVRGGPIINDVLESDLSDVGIDKKLDSRIVVMPSMDVGYPGTILKMCTKEFLKVFDNADVVISKGQGNFETLLFTEKKRNLFFLLKCKCDPISTVIGKELGTLVFLQTFDQSKTEFELDW